MNRDKVKICHLSAVPMTLWVSYRGLIKRLNDKCYEVALISSGPQELERFKNELGIKTFAVEITRRFTPFRDLIAIFKLWRLFRRERFDIVHAHTPKAVFVGMVASFLACVPNRVSTIHGSLMLTSRGLRRKLLWMAEWATSKLSTHTLIVGQSLRNHMLDEKLYSAEKLQILGKGSACGVDLSYFNPDSDFAALRKQTREKFQIPGDAVVIGFVGRLGPEKGIEALVRAFEKLQKLVPQSYLLLVGQFETIRSKLGVETLDALRNNPHICCNGQFTCDVLPFYAAMDVYILPSKREGFSMTLLEAAAVSLPTITTTAVGCADAVENNVTGFLVEVDNVEQMFDVMLRLVEDSKLRKKLGRKGRERVRQFYDSKILIAQHIKFYRSLSNQNCITH